jgi:hypothetical protein
MFWLCDVHGERPDPEVLIITGPDDYTAQPAVMSKKYVTLMLPDDPDLNNEVDRP